MTQLKEENEGIPSLADFTESSLLDQIKDKEVEKVEEVKEERKDENPEEKQARVEAEEKEKEEEEKVRLAKEQEDELTGEEKEKEEEEDEGEGSFWDDVDALTGNTYEVDYGDVDPDSPEGAVIREETVAKTAIESNLAYLEEKFPEGFKALMHVSNGGEIKDILTPDTVDYKNFTVEEEDTDKQKDFMKNFYMEKGFSEAKAMRNVEDDEDSEEGLFENFTAALKEKQDAQEAASQAAFESQAQAKAAQEARDKSFGENLSNIINTGKVGNFQVDKKDAEEFYNHVLSNVQRQGENYVLSLPLTSDNLQTQLEQMFFGFKKGDLSKFVTTTAKTENTKRLKRSMRKDKTEESSSEDGKRKRGSKLPTLGAFESN